MQLELITATGKVAFSDGWGNGSEFLLRKNKGHTTGWLGCACLVAERNIAGVNNNQPYYAPFDKRHNLSLTVVHPLSERVQLSSNIVCVQHRQAITVPQDVFVWNNIKFANYTERNGYRLPDYHRLDLALTLQGKKNPMRDWKSEWVFGVYNVYSRKNIFSLYIKQKDRSVSGMQAYSTYLFGVVPSVTYNIKL